MQLYLQIISVAATALLLAGCDSGTAPNQNTRDTRNANPAAATRWTERAGCYQLANPDNRTGFNLVAVMAPALGEGKYPLRLAMSAGDYYYLCIPLKVLTFNTEDASGTFALEKPELVPEWNGEAPWWPFKAGEHRFWLEGEGANAKLVLKMDNKEYRLSLLGNHPLMAYQGNYLSAAGASRAEHLFLTLGPMPDTSNVVLGFQEYDKRHAAIQIQVVDPESRLCRVTMKNFIYSPMSTTQTPTRTYPGRFVPTRSQWPGYDLVVDFGEGREVRYELSAK
jgi:hypothetical protein